MTPTQTASFDLARVRARRTGMVNSLWPWDAYPELPILEPGATVTIADLPGPAVITCLHATRFANANEHRGIILRIYWDDETVPAVQCPIGDFFCDALQGKGQYFSTPFMEKVPEARNCYLPMPFRSRARIELTNETDRRANGYAYVEYETLPAWENDLACFHATWDRQEIYIPREVLPLANITGRGHLVGVSLGITSTEPRFEGAHFVMEGNDEHFIDGEATQSLDYLGTEDYFTYSWGFQRPFIGTYAAIPHCNHGVMPLELAVFRFRANNVIRFERSLRIQVNWGAEFTRSGKDSSPGQLRAWLDEVGGRPIDVASTVFWYQVPGSGPVRHKPLLPLAERVRPY